CGDSVTICARRPLRDVGWVSTTPELVSSLTIVETVAAESPVASISSTCVRPPNSLTVSMTSVRFASRNEDCEPVVRLTAASQAHASGGPSHGRRTAPLAVDVDGDRGREPGRVDQLDLREAADLLARLDDERAVRLPQRGLRTRRPTHCRLTGAC